MRGHAPQIQIKTERNDCMTNYREMDDGTLVDLSLLGEDGAFEELVERHEGEVKKKAVSIIGNPYTAEDIAQDSSCCRKPRQNALETL